MVFTNQKEIISSASIDRRCHVRFYSELEKFQRKIPSPYDRHGTGDAYYITSKESIEGSGLEALVPPYPTCLNQGWDPTAVLDKAPMLGLDIFCGGGNFGRGLEEGGAVEFDWAVDWYKEAIHTYRANQHHPDEASLFYGSVNDYLTQAMQGKKNHRVAPFGEVEFIAAGSPCQGFSQANPLKGNDRSLFNVSMVASVVAFIDFYRPKYALLENVKGIATGSNVNNVLAQIICSLVGLGYQVRTFVLEAWNFGSPQSRSRVFISVSAPGMLSLPEPPLSHSHPETIRGGSLGKTANGLHSISRFSTITPFDYVTSAEATSDLPETDGRTACIPFPDHKESRSLSTLARVGLSSVPRFPGGCSFVRATERGYMPEAQKTAWSWNNPIRSRSASHSWQRVRRNALMPTILTRQTPEDGVCGNSVNWDEHRLLTVQEARRGQGFPDYEVLIGSPAEQWKIVGNSVARTVALALGMSLRNVWLANDMRSEASKLIATTHENEIGGQKPSIRRKGSIAGEEAADSRCRTVDVLNRIRTSLTASRIPVENAVSVSAGNSVAGSDIGYLHSKQHVAPSYSLTGVSEAKTLCNEVSDILSNDGNPRQLTSNNPIAPYTTDPQDVPMSAFPYHVQKIRSNDPTKAITETPTTSRPLQIITNETVISTVTITESISVEGEQKSLQS